MYEDMQPVLQGSRPEDVMRALQNLVRSFPEFARAHNDLGTLYYRSGEKQKALGHFERAATISPADPLFLKNLADYYHVEMARAEDAVRLYLKIVEVRPHDVQILLTAAHLLVGLRRFEEAAAHYRKALDIEPWNVEANENLQKLLRIPTEAQDGRRPEEMHAEAQRLMGQGNASAARLQLEKILNIHSEFALAHNDLGVLCFQAGEKDQALRHYEEAVRLQPENHTFQKNLADFYYVEQGRVEHALQIYVRILATRPEDIETLMAVAHVCESVSKIEDARTFYERVLEIEPWNTEARQQLDHLQKGSISEGCAGPPASAQDAYAEACRLIAGGNHPTGRARLMQIVALHPDFALAHNDLGVLAYQAGDKQAALEYYQKAVQLEPANLTFLKNLADCYWVGFGRMEDALKIYVDILKVQPEEVETLLATGKLCLALRQPNDARVFFDRVLEIEPWNTDAHQQLEQLESASKAA
jgi:tetratricopeptide (TPR) repeat protein